MTSRFWGFTLPLVALLVLAACAPQQLGGTVSFIGVWGGDELASFEAMVAPFEEDTGIDVQFEGTRDLNAILTTRVEAGNPPDVAGLPGPGQLQEFAAAGALVPLDGVLDMNAVRAQYGQSWIDLGSYNGQLYGIFIKAAVKSLVWYNPKAFTAAGYTIPTTWDELIALSDQIVADGGTPWCVGLESGEASGWPATDWIEDIMLRTAGPQVYDQWISHEISWTDPAIVRAWELFGQIAANEDYLFGGTTGVLSTNFGESPLPMFSDPPGCYLHRQASFITSFFLEGNPDLVAGEDYAFFGFPSIDAQWGTPALGAADLVGMFNDTPQARALINYLATAPAQQIWVERGGALSPNKNVSLDAYPDDISRGSAQLLVGAEVFRFDASDLMPAAVNEAFWKGTLDYVGGTDLNTVLANIEAVAQEAYGS
ncbi:MAG: extracellular solute-binding protein [Chloroflexi bacterium]|nr:extracellular solute-binding protein [Chloroflexota bacterium]